MHAMGANATLAGTFETTKGTNPAVNAVNLPFRTFGLGGAAPLIEDDTVGFGRSPRDPDKDGLDVDGDIVIPHDDRYLGYWLKLFCGAPTTVAALAAASVIALSAQPAANSTFTLNGTAWTWVTGAPTGNQIQLGANLAASLTAAATALNASVETQTVKNTYTAGANSLTITNKTLGPTGNSYTLAVSAASNMTLPANTTTLTGGANTHTFKTGASTLLSMFLELARNDLSSFSDYTYGTLNTIKGSVTRKGMADLTLSLFAQNETPVTASAIGTITDLGTYQRFTNRSAGVRTGGVLMGNVESGDFTVSNNIEMFDPVREDGLRDGFDPGMVSAKGQVTIRLADMNDYNKAVAGQKRDLVFGYSLGVGRSVTWSFARCTLARPKLPVDGPGGLKAQFDWVASYDSSSAAVLTVTLTNGVTGY